MTRRAALLEAIATNLRRISIAAGFQTDAGLYVTLEPGQTPDAQAAVVTAIVERQARATDPAVARTHRLTTVAVVIKVRIGADDTWGGIDRVSDDVEHAMADTQVRFPVGIQFPQYQEMQPLPPEPGSGWTGAIFRYTSHIPIR